MLKNIPTKVYEGISFEKGSFPNLSTLSNYFIDEGIFINNKGTEPVIKSVPQYIQMISSNIENGNILSIKESELENSIQIYGKVAQVSSKYCLEFEGKGGFSTRYGVNLFQLILHNETWLISSMCWDDREDKSLFEPGA